MKLPTKVAFSFKYPQTEPSLKQSPIYDFHLKQGARLLPEAEARPLLTYGDVPGEYEAATTAWVAMDDTDRGAVLVKGQDAASFLHGLLANEVRNLPSGAETTNLLLDAKGKVRFVFELRRTSDEEFQLSTEPGQASELLQALELYLFSEDVELSEVTDQHAPITIAGPDVEGALAALVDRPLPEEGSAALTMDGLSLVASKTSRATLPAWKLDPGADNACALWQALVTAGARPIGRIVWDSLRAEVGLAQPGEDIDETVYPQEARLEHAFSLEKGCYIGQEVVAKIDTYGGLNKRLCLLRVDHDDPIPRGTRLHREDPDSDEWRDLGVATTWAYSFAHDCGVILAFVKRKHQESGTLFRLGEGPARATLIELQGDEA